MSVFAVDFPNPFDIGKDAIKAAANGVLDVIADAIGTAVEAATASVGTAWIRVDTPSLATADGHASPIVAFLQSDLKWIVAAFAVIAILITAGRAAHDGEARHLGDLVKGVVMLTLVMGASAAAVQLVVAASDETAQRIIDHALEGDTFGKHLAVMLAPGGAGAVMGVIVLGFVAFLATLVQVALLAFRAGVLVVLTAVLPVAFALYPTETGREWARRLTTWVLAFALYKPCAALVYAASFRLIDAGAFSANGLVKATVGVMLMVVAILALPGLLRVLAPAVQAVHLRSSSSGGALAAAAAMPTGARLAASSGQTLAQLGGMPTGAVNAPAPQPPRGTP